MGKFIDAINKLSNVIDKINYSILDIRATLDSIDHNIIATNIYMKRLEDKLSAETTTEVSSSVELLDYEHNMIRPCLYFDNDGEHSVAFHFFNENTAVIELADGTVKEVPFNDIKFLDSKVTLRNFNRIDDGASLKRYWGNEECFEKELKQLKREQPGLFAE